MQDGFQIPQSLAVTAYVYNTYPKKQMQKYLGDKKQLFIL